MTSAAFTSTRRKKVCRFFQSNLVKLRNNSQFKSSQADCTWLGTLDTARVHLGLPPPQLVTEQSLSNPHYRLWFFCSLDNFSNPSISQDPRSPVRIHSGVEQIVITFFLFPGSLSILEKSGRRAAIRQFWTASNLK